VLLKKAWHHFLGFLELVGLRRETAGDYGRRLKQLKLRYYQFRDLLTANNELLEIIAEFEERLLSDARLGMQYVRSRTLSALTSTHRMVDNLNALSQGRYPAVSRAFEKIQLRISASLTMGETHGDRVWVLPLSELARQSAPLVGNKMAVLGELRNRLGMPVPDAVAITTHAYRRFLDAAGGADAFAPPKPGGPSEELEAFSRRAREVIQGTAVPDELASSILSAYRGLSQENAPPPLVSVRSSALKEDSELSFAGQYATVLNVGESGLLDAYKAVLASIYEPQAIEYRRSMGIDESDVAVAAGCVQMVDALCSGVAFSRHPVDPSSDRVLIHAGWGLGPSIVDGKVDPDVYLVDRAGDPPLVSCTPARKPLRVVGLAGQGVAEEPVPPEMQNRPCLGADEARAIATLCVRLEAHFGEAQDVEWAMDRDHRIHLLQSRPLTRVHEEAETKEVLPTDARLLLEGGTTAVPGAGSGPVFLAESEDSLDRLPQGGVLVAAQSSPKYVRAMKRASAIVTDVGSAIGHMASLAREFGVPTLLGTGRATQSLTPGEVVTVDATRRRVFSGRIPEVLEAQPPRRHLRPRGQAYSVLEEVAKYVVPLSLTDPRDPNFTPLSCTTLHDVARYVHERSFQEMFGIGELVGDVRSGAPYLDVFLPMDLYILDLGGGVDVAPGARKVKPSQIASAPFAAVVRGMLHKGIPRFGPRAMDAKGFFHVMMRHGLSGAETESTLRDPCYAIVSDRYLNLASRVGYHFSAVDCYCCDAINQNYISFRFKGGAADAVRRERRVRAIAQILRELGFEATVRNDLLAASFRKREPQDILQNLEMLGRLLQFMRQMDAAMSSDAMVDKTVKDFLAGNYGLEPSGS
jgi:pyruvate,water dikinase